jgi:DNA-binding beta-propeller fold protein YncE
MGSRDQGHRALFLIMAITMAVAATPFSSTGMADERCAGFVAQKITVPPHRVPVFVLEWGEQGTGVDELRAPVHVASPSSGFVYVSDQVEDRVQKFDGEGTYQTLWGGSGETEGKFDNPWGLGIDSAGNVYVADDNNDRIQKFDSNGIFIVTWGWGVETGASQFEKCTEDCQAGKGGIGLGQLASPMGLAVDSADNVFVGSYGGSRIVKYASNGDYLDDWGSNGTAEGEFNVGPSGIAVDADGYVYTSEGVNARVQVFDSSGNFVRMWGYGVDDNSPQFQVCTSGCGAGIQGAGEWQFQSASGMVVDSNNYLYVADYGNDRIYKFDREGNRLAQWSAGNGPLDGPLGISLDGPSLYLVDAKNYRIVKYMGPFFETYVGEVLPEPGR